LGQEKSRVMQRRDLIMGVVCLGAAGLSLRLKPHRRAEFLHGQKLVNIVPLNFGNWRSESGENLTSPETEGPLAASLYSEIVSRIYQNTVTGDEIMMLIAYGTTQSEKLQLHRPEICYPAVGYRVVDTRPSTIAIKTGVSLPNRRVIAERSDRNENIVYWTRLGEFLPRNSGEQRDARVLTAMRGYVSDGVLFRVSMLGEAQPSFAMLDRFASDVVLAVPAAGRAALVGPSVARALAA
jgi:EpsI family protein